MPCPEPDRAHPGLLTGNRKKTTAITACATMRLRCKQIGHALGDELHDGDRWIASRPQSTRQAARLAWRALRLDGAPGFEVITAIGDE
ncbi:hypothetical protein B4U45_22850 [Mycobacterium persicum]|uniref:Uncharacterized protein n=1 Tax=Mycobacterium persicum TaxID=1487726 RepID=A0A8E2IVV3_9MYCO|nr:hypothetical protein A4G31_21430 [Mycobacterium persicum]ORB56622.1 hypothetical protein BST40_04720 [Mycobacterium persicum]ORB96844.1 hypothetical protein B1T44_22705 [Mycobacterium persicum]ORC09011.1 hypothetical protein B4U45_22850 [Mycobacterium persicum]ORC13210.1 hypothetical protein B1T46_23090 [Mycobacterium kansasii]